MVDSPFYPHYSASWRCFLLSTIEAKCSIAHSIMGRQACINDSPRPVILYSTRGGTSAYTNLSTSPSSSRWRNVSVSTFCDMSGMCLRRTEKRKGTLLPAKMWSTSSDHLSPIRESTLRIGQSGKSMSRTSTEFIIS